MKTRTHIISYPNSLRFMVVMGLVMTTMLQANAMANATPPPTPSVVTLQSSYGKLPLSFEANHGQWDPAVQFVTRGRGHTLFLAPNEAVLSVRTGVARNRSNAIDATRHNPLSNPSTSSQSVVRMTFAGADAHTETAGLDPLPGIVNYFIGDNPTKWRTNIPTYQKVEYKNLYAGIDLVYYGNQGQLEYDLVVKPGADPNQIRLAFDGAEQIAVDEQGDLVLTLPQQSSENAEQALPTLRLHSPVVYQRNEQGEKHLLTGSYVFKPATDRKAVALHSQETTFVAFQVASYDASKPLIIDPVLSWATYLGGSGWDDSAGSITLDASGNVYVTGSTSSSDFPGTAGSPIQNTLRGPMFNAFVTKFNASGTTILYSTYLGGGGDNAYAIAVDASGNAYVTGFTSGDFPGTASSAIQSTMRSQHDAFVTKLNATGSALLYSTYLGSSAEDFGRAIAVDRLGNAYVTGETWWSDFPGTSSSPIQSTFGGDIDVFITKINIDGTAILYSTYLGGEFDDYGNGIAVDQEGQAYVTGSTRSLGFPGTADSPIQNTLRGGRGGPPDAFVTKLNAEGTAIAYSTYLGGNHGSGGGGIVVDQESNAYITGDTSASDFPGTADSSIQSMLRGSNDAFVTKVNPAGTALIYSTYLGGRDSDSGRGIALDYEGNAYVIGETFSSDFPSTVGNSIQSTLRGVSDTFVTKVNPLGTALTYSSYLGGPGDERRGGGIAVDAAGNAYVTGYTSSLNFPGTTDSSLQSTLSGISDAFVAKISSSIPFAAFDARAKIDVNDRHHGGDASYHRPHRNVGEGRYYQHQDGDEFDLKATFTLGGGGNGIDPLKEAVMIQVGTFSTSIPSGSFKQHKGRYVFEGTINGVHLEAVIRSLILGNDYELKVEGHGADLTGTTNPVTVSVTIGDDSGSKSITAKIK